jgi:hypothetical protein
MGRQPSRVVAGIVVVVLVALGCSATPVATPSGAGASMPAASDDGPRAEPSGQSWAEDLARIDAQVRAHHPNPFANNPESAWVAKLAELAKTLPGATPDEQTVQLASLVGLLDTHTCFCGPARIYPVWMYRFPEGWFVVRAKNESLIGARLISIGGRPIDQIETALRPLIPSDNESGELTGLQDVLPTSEFLHGLGIVRDLAKPAFVLSKSDGSNVTVDVEPEVVDSEWGAGLIGYLLGDADEAVARRREPVWTRLDKPSKTFLLSYNDYTENDLGPALAAMKAALDDGSALRVVVDMRYIRGGNGGLAAPLIDAVKTDKRINRVGGLTVLIGRENASAGTVVAGALDRDTQAVLIGEPTPARADNFLCECMDITLHNSPWVVSIPTQFLANGDKRGAVLPDVPFALSAADFFAGRDPALALALAGSAASPRP